MDEHAEQAALVSSLMDEVQALVPIPYDVLHTALVQAFSKNGPHVHLEVASVMATRAEEFSPHDVGVLKTHYVLEHTCCQYTRSFS